MKNFLFLFTIYIILISLFISNQKLLGQPSANNIICNRDSIKRLLNSSYAFENESNNRLGINQKYIQYEKDTVDFVHKKMDSLVKLYIIARSGMDLFKDISSNYDANPNFKIKSNGFSKIKYIHNYSFFMNDSIEYHFFIKFDSKGNIIIDHQIPDVKSDKEFRKIIDFCEALKIARQDEYFKYDLMEISLEYSKKFNQFVWCIKTEELHHAITSYDYFILIGARAGKIIGHRKHK